ncbi:Gfo/Idh/MocA family protein [Ilumatobacter coccineus]|uniref:Putative oxidoreductase n=1 Tax=Ilumatobacter coccineus (strain NBRC 103263 / KCTC 29153 / YM16-304) TaxID=1313172 RepID=A0A6C7E5D4_ILUCY|nr:Gfo/Idh/MocA family oxidoreductase [Ilumatobacter coccineus]BAN01760.1 putative oxidoreductase [Ilumatobacter coccineus YM16-304]
MVNIAVIGYGYWGPNLVRNFAATGGASVTVVCDQNQARLDEINKIYPAIRTCTSVDEVFGADDVEAVAIATPVTSHFDLALGALESGLHVLVEKPMTSTSDEAKKLIEVADAAGLTLMVDHTFVYTSAVRKIRELIDDGRLGKLHYFDSVRVNLGLFQSDVSVVWDLAVHDLSIMDHLLNRSPKSVSCTGVAHVAGQPENMAYITCMFDDDLIAHFHVNWLAPVKVRQTLICGSEQMIVYDDVDMSEKVKVYDKGIILDDDAKYQRHVGYRTGDMWAPRLDNVEALALEAQHFIECIETGATPLSDGHAGLRVIEILEAAAASMVNGGTPVSLPGNGSHR